MCVRVFMRMVFVCMCVCVYVRVCVFGSQRRPDGTNQFGMIGGALPEVGGGALVTSDVAARAKAAAAALGLCVCT